jgi:hypothetical protein
VFAVGNLLRGRMPFPIHPGDELEFDLVPAGQHRFSPALYRGGKLFNIEMGGTFEFDVDGNRREQFASAVSKAPFLPRDSARPSSGIPVPELQAR